MTHLIVLPGNSPKNKTWGELMLATYGARFDSSFMQTYDHWESGESTIDFEREQSKLAAQVAALALDTSLILFTKSAGSLLAFLAISKKIITPTKCVFFGIPFDLAADSLFKDGWSVVDGFTIPAVAFHNQFDPTAEYVFTRDILSVHAPHITLVTLPESDHSYHNVALYTDTLNLFLG